jgi:hypothetical protein
LKNEIFNIEKLQLHSLINEMNSNNLDETLVEIEKHMKLLKMVNQVTYKDKTTLEGGTFRIVSEEKQDTSKTVGEESKETAVLDSNKIQKINKLESIKAASSLSQTVRSQGGNAKAEDGSWIIDKLQRDLKGGYIDGFLYVPEKIIREMDFKEGDWIKAKLSRVNNFGKRLYEYTMEARGVEKPEHESKRKMERYAIVKNEKSLNVKVIQVTPEDTEISMTVALHEGDVATFGIEENDVIDYAYWKGDLLHGRVVWKYDTRINGSIHEALQRKRRIIENGECTVTGEAALKEKTVLMVGSHSKSHELRVKNLVENQEGTFSYCDGTEILSIMEDRLKKANVAIVFTEYVSPECMNATKEFGKKYNVDIIFTKQIPSKELGRLILSAVKTVSIKEEGAEKPQTAPLINEGER